MSTLFKDLKSGTIFSMDGLSGLFIKKYEVKKGSTLNAVELDHGSDVRVPENYPCDIRQISATPLSALRIEMKIDKWIGIEISYKKGTNRCDVLREAEEEYSKMDRRLSFSSSFLRLEAPCRTVKEYKNPSDIPLIDIPCPCGNPCHMMISWKEID